MTKEKKTVIITCLIIILIVTLSLIFMGINLYNNWKLKSSEGTLYIVVKQYEVVDEHFKIGDEGIIIFEAPFTDELYYQNTIYTQYGYNTILIENGTAKVIDADCPRPYSLNGCMSSIITNDKQILDNALIRCMQHGISIGWEVRTDEN